MLYMHTFLLCFFITLKLFILYNYIIILKKFIILCNTIFNLLKEYFYLQLWNHKFIIFVLNICVLLILPQSKLLPKLQIKLQYLWKFFSVSHSSGILLAPWTSHLSWFLLAADFSGMTHSKCWQAPFSLQFSFPQWQSSEGKTWEVPMGGRIPQSHEWEVKSLWGSCPEHNPSNPALGLAGPPGWTFMMENQIPSELCGVLSSMKCMESHSEHSSCASLFQFSWAHRSQEWVLPARVSGKFPFSASF